MKTIETAVITTALALAGLLASACGSASSPAPDPGPASASCSVRATLSPAAASGDLRHRAYVASRDSGNVTVIDLDSLTIAASVDTCTTGYHMVELNADFTKAYASGPGAANIDVFDARTLGLSTRIKVGKEPTHLSLSKDGKYLASVNEGDNAVAFIDPREDRVVKSLPGFYTPHFVRFAPDGRYAYVANASAYHVTRVDLQTLTIDGHIALDGFAGPPHATEVTEQVGFADVQIDGSGILWGAHGESGQVLVYDTKAQQKLPEITAGIRPWIVYAEHPFANVEARLVPNHGDRNVALLDRVTSSATTAAATPAATVMTGEPESYGVNYSPLAPDKAFVMNRIRQEIAVVDTTTKKVDAIIAVGGNTETASTTADGRWIVATVSSANRVVIIDAVTNAIVKTFDGVGNYPWTVTIPLGQNYCH